MENILKIIYDKSFNKNTLNINDIEKILELLIINKNLNDYILSINIQPIKSDILASYSNYTQNITLYTEMIEYMIKNIDKNTLITNDFEKILYKNLCIFQILLHEVEHANQQKIAYNENSLEAFILRASFLIKNAYEEELYEYCPEERLAEIKSYEELMLCIKYLNKKPNQLSEILQTEELQRLLRGYHYKNNCIECPLITYFSLSERADILEDFDILNIQSNNLFNVNNLKDKMKFGFPISINQYGQTMNKLVLSLNKNFKNRTNILLR